MKKNEQVAEFTGDVYVCQHAKVAPLASALGVIFADFQIAVARLVLTSQGMPKLESQIVLSSNIHPTLLGHLCSYQY